MPLRTPNRVRLSSVGRVETSGRLVGILSLRGKVGKVPCS